MNCTHEDIAVGRALVRTGRLTWLDDAVGKLAAEGDADQIADYLFTHGHTGRVGESETCPVHRYLRAVTGRDVAVAPGMLLPDNGPYVGMPEVVTEFVRRFDRGDYPDLIDEDPR